MRSEQGVRAMALLICPQWLWNLRESVTGKSVLSRPAIPMAAQRGEGIAQKKQCI